MDVSEQLALCEALLRGNSDLLCTDTTPKTNKRANDALAPQPRVARPKLALPPPLPHHEEEPPPAHNATAEEEARHLRVKVIGSWAVAMGAPMRNYQDAERLAPQCFINRASHTCTMDCKRENLAYGGRFRDPIQESQVGESAPILKASGKVFLCTHSGAFHHCDGEQCQSYITIYQGTIVCQISGLTVGASIPNAPQRAQRNLLHTASFGKTAPPAPSDEQKPAAAATKKPAGKRTTTPALHRSSKRRYAPGSVAERMQMKSEGGRQCREPEYDRHLVQFSFESLTEAQRNSSRLFCELLLFSPMIGTLFLRRQENALHNANQLATRYVNKCVQRGYIHETNFHMFVASIYRRLMEPLAEGVFLRIYCTREDETLARRYFSEAVVRTWKIIEATPYCCEYETFSGGATAKKRCSHTHLKKLAPAILYLLHAGLYQMVSYHRVTRLVMFTSESDAPPSGPDVVTERVAFIPPHRYLWRLPEENQLRSIDFSLALSNGSPTMLYESVNKSLAAASANANAASYDPELIATQRRVRACYRSLLSIQPPLTIECVRQYRLQEHLPTMDSDPSTGRFVSVGDSQDV